MKPSANFTLTRTTDISPVKRGGSTSAAAYGVQPSDACDLCYAACQFLPEPERTYCLLACDVLC